MTEETIRIYAVFPCQGNGEKREIIINALEKESYLDCKFWQETEEKAKRFFNCYFHGALDYLENSKYNGSRNPVNIANLYHLSHSKLRPVKITSQSLGTSIVKKYHLAHHWDFTIEGIMTKQDVTSNELDILNNNGIFKNWVQENWLKIEYKNSKDEEVYLNITNEELAGWYKSKLEKAQVNEATAEYFINKPVFKGKLSINETHIKILKPILLSPLFCLTYADAKALFFPAHEILEELKESLAKKEVRGFYGNSNNDYYFLARDLLKWLMKHDYLLEWLTREFEDLKIESLEPDDIKDEAFSVEKLIALLYEEIGQYLNQGVDLLKQLQIFEDSLKELFKKSLKLEKWSMEVLPAFIAGFNLKGKVISNRKIYIPIKGNPENLIKNGNRSIDDNFKKSIEETINAAKNHIKIIQDFLNKNSENHGLLTLSPFEWVDASASVNNRIVELLEPSNTQYTKGVKKIHDLIVEIFKEKQINPLGLPEITFTSLDYLSKKGESKDKILQNGMKGTQNIFLKYPMKIKYYKGVKQKINNFPKLRYKGFGQLYVEEKHLNEELNAELFGNCTLHALYMGGKISNYINDKKFGGGGNATHKIYLIPTEEEAKYLLQPYIEVSADEIDNLISDKNLMIIEEEIKKIEKEENLTAIETPSKDKEIIPNELKVEKKKNKLSVPNNDEQLLCRTAIKKNYPLIKNGKTQDYAWEGIFRRQDKNGLKETMIKSEGRKQFYSKEKLEKWIIKNAKYTEEQLKDKAK